MECMKAGLCVGLFVFNLLLAASCERVKEKMYKSINGAFCFKKLNGTHEFGCSSSRSGNIGVLHIIKTKKDVDWLLNEANASPYVVMLPFDLNNFSGTMLALKNSGKVSGFILVSIPTSFSPDDVCPNRYSGLPEGQCDDSKPWNTAGTSLSFVNFGFPVMYINSDENMEDIKFLQQCFEKYNAHDLESQSSRSLCALELRSHMLAAVDSKTCIRRNFLVNFKPIRFCDPLRSFNIHLPLFPRIHSEGLEKKEKSVILVVSRLDSSSMFHALVPGAGSSMIGIVSLLTVAHILSNLIKGKDAPDGNVIFVFFNGESYDYIGSSRMIYDMERNAFPHKLRQDVPLQTSPLELKDIGLIVEIDQVTKNEIFYHSLDRFTDTDGLVVRFIKALKEESKNKTMKVSSATGRLPPSSLQRFLRKDPSIQGMVLSSYNYSFDNRYYHSIFDTGENLNFKYFNKTQPEPNSIQTYVTEFSLAVARALFKVLFHAEPSKWESSEKLVFLVDELLYCYLVSPSCETFEKVTLKKFSYDKPFSSYVNVMQNNLTGQTALTLAWLTGKEVSRNQSACHNNVSDSVHQYIWMAGESKAGVCIETLTALSVALSPAFIIKDYDWSSNEYSTWTESVWKENMAARVFIKPSKAHEILTLSIGLVIFMLSFIIVYFINSKANVLFSRQI